MLRDSCQRRNLESWLGGFGWVGTGCWCMSGLLLGASLVRRFTIILRIAVATFKRSCMVGGWVQVGGC